MKKKKASKPKKGIRKAIKKKKPAKSAKKKTIKKKNAVKAAPQKPKKSLLGELAGVVTHFFSHVQAAVIKVKAPKLWRGDLLHIKGHTTDFKMTLDSMQIDHKPIETAGKGAEIGIQVPGRVREGDKVYRLKSL